MAVKVTAIAVTAVVGSIVGTGRTVDRAAASYAVERSRVVGKGRRNDVNDRRPVDGDATGVPIVGIPTIVPPSGGGTCARGQGRQARRSADECQ